MVMMAGVEVVVAVMVRAIFARQSVKSVKDVSVGQLSISYVRVSEL